VVTTVVTRAAPHYLIADEPPLAVRRTRGGNAWQARKDGQAAPAATGSAGAEPPVLLGMPAIGRPGS
jgi:tRNA-2-methylthio-N6-dimethylallyladenosine synthase